MVVNPKNQDSLASSIETQPTQLDIETLGRQRPDTFKTRWAEYGFCFSLLASMFMAVSNSFQSSWSHIS